MSPELANIDRLFLGGLSFGPFGNLFSAALFSAALFSAALFSAALFSAALSSAALLSAALRRGIPQAEVALLSAFGHGDNQFGLIAGTPEVFSSFFASSSDSTRPSRQRELERLVPRYRPQSVQAAPAASRRRRIRRHPG